MATQIISDYFTQELIVAPQTGASGDGPCIPWIPASNAGAAAGYVAGSVAGVPAFAGAPG